MKIYLFLLLSLSFLQAQTYEEYLKEQESAFVSFKEERDKEFSDFLKKDWKEYRESKGLKVYEVKKPRTLPKLDIKKTAPDKKPHEKLKLIVIKKEKLTRKQKVYKQIIIKPSSNQLKTLYFTYFGVDLQVNYDKSILFNINSKISKKEISKSWDKLANSKYEEIIKDINTISDKLKLNDWAKYLLVKQISNSIYNHKNEEKLFLWFALLKMDYDTHIAYKGNKLIILLPVKGEFYNTTYYRLGKKKYYAINYYAKGSVGQVSTYKNSYEGATKSLNFYLEDIPRFAQIIVKKSLKFKIGKDVKNIHLKYNKNLTMFFNSYPQVSYINYFSASDSALLKDSIKEEFEPLIVGKTQEEALDIILNFVQNAFKYKVDAEQFNIEKVMFASETIFYPYSDCEDRAILFSYMVKLLLNIDVIGLKYPNHMATAVNVDEKLKGDYVTYKNRSYLVADPTYINAKVGVSMYKFKKGSSYSIVATGAEK